MKKSSDMGRRRSDPLLLSLIHIFVVVVLVVVLQFVTKLSIWNMCNIFFIAMVLSYGPVSYTHLYYQEFVDARLTGDWVTSWELVYRGDAYLDALPGAMMLTYHLYNGSEWTATLMIVAIQGNHADTFTLAFWEELGHEGLPSYFNQVMRIIESITLLN